MENIIIETGNLKDKSAESYFSLFNDYATSKTFPVKNSFLFYDKLSKLKQFPVNLSCAVRDSTLYSKSKINLFKYNLSREINSGFENSTMLDVNIGKVIVESFDASDFNNQYIKYSMLLLITQHGVGLKSLTRETPYEHRK